MNYNIIGYIVFFTIMFYVIGVVGWKLYSLGRPFMLENMKKELHLVDPMNKLLLVLYYLFNLGYVAMSIQYWDQIDSLKELINLIGVKSGTVIIILGVTHYFNLYWLSNFHKIIEKLNNKNGSINRSQ
tara:strand:- start:30 stop:413 length:384 start_codon:yes stop_codon:yes gene_type:complete